jgi:hypothetical protein
MHDQAVGASELTAGRIERMQVDGVLGIEAVHGGRCTEAHRYRLAARQIKSAQSQFVRRLSTAIDSLPHPLQDTAIDCRLEPTPGYAGQDLATCGHVALVVEELLEFGIHGQDHRSQQREAVAPDPSPVDERRTVHSQRLQACAKCPQFAACRRTDTHARGSQLGAEVGHGVRQWIGAGLPAAGAEHAQHRRHTLRVGGVA